MFALAAPVGDVSAQTGTETSGAIVGTVLDQTFAPLPLVRVEISSPALMVPLSTLTTAAGHYRFLALPPAEYSIVFSRHGFVPSSRRGVVVSLAAATTADAEMVAGLLEDVTVLGAPPVLDRQSASVAVRFDAARLANLPGARNLGAVLSAVPGVQLARFDIGGSAGLVSPQFGAYGTSGGQPMLEGILIGLINPYGLTVDYGSIQEVSATAAASGPNQLTPGVRMQFVTKAGGDRYHGSLYADYGNQGWQAFNIDATQILREAAAGGSLPPDANRLWRYHDMNADVGGFISKDRLWWYGSGRQQTVSARLVSFPVKPYLSEAWNATIKTTYRINPAHRIVAFATAMHAQEPTLLDAFRPAGTVQSQTSAINRSEDSTSKRLAFGTVTKLEWNGTFGPSMFAEARIGRFAPSRKEIPNGTEPRFENLTTSEVTGGNRSWEASLSVPQLSVTSTYFKDGWSGSHHLRFGAEFARWTESQSWHQGYPGDVLHVLQNDSTGQGMPVEVYRFRTPSRSVSGLWSHAGYVNDAWQMYSRLTLTAGLRFDHFRSFLPEQTFPAGDVTASTRTFASKDLIEWNLVSPRGGLVYAVRGNGKTLVKASYGHYASGLSTDLGFTANPNTNQPWARYRWVDDGDRLWQPGEETEPLATRGPEQIDPELKPPTTREFTAFLEHELPGAVAIRSGVVWRGLRDPYARQDDNRPSSAYTGEVTFVDPGPDGVTGDGDDGPLMTGFRGPGGPSANVVRNVPGAATDHWTWEITAAKRSGRRWSLVAGFAHTWSRDHAREYAGQPIRQNMYPLTPNDLINTAEGGRHQFTVWSAKILGTVELPWSIHIAPFVRHQAGQPFGRTLANQVPGIERILAEPIGTRRMPNFTSVDARVEKGFGSNATGRRVGVFVDVFNLLNANPEQNISWVSGTMFLRPLTIVPPRIARVGVKVDW